jgi:hypothetical protein
MRFRSAVRSKIHNRTKNRKPKLNSKDGTRRDASVAATNASINIYKFTHISTCVNAHRLPGYVGRTIRLVGKTLKVSSSR